MNRIYIISSLFFLSCFLLFFPVTVRAEQERVVTITQDMVHEGDFFAAGDRVDIAGTVTGDVYVAGGQVSISGEVSGDVMIAGGQVFLDGVVDQDVRVLAGQLHISGIVNGNVSSITGEVYLEKATVVGNAVFLTGSLRDNGNIEGDLVIVSEDAQIDGEIAGDVLARVQLLRLADTASISGNLNYSDYGDSVIDSTLVQGEVVQTMLPALPDNAFLDKDFFEKGLDIFRFISLISSVFVGLLIVHYLPNYSFRTISILEDRAGSSFLIGLVALIVAPVVCSILLISVFGMFLSFVGFVFFGLLLYFSRIVFMYWLGARFLTRLARQADKTVTMLVGAGLYYLLSTVIVLAPLTALAGALFGSGALMLSIQKTYLSARKLKLL